MENNDNNANRTPRVVLGRDVPAGATVAYQVGDDGWDGWEVDVLEDPAAVLASDKLVAVLDEPEHRPWPSAPLIRVWEGSDSERPLPPGILMVREDARGSYWGVSGEGRVSAWPGVAGDTIARWEAVEAVPTSVLNDLAAVDGVLRTAEGDYERRTARARFVGAARNVLDARGELV